MNVTVSKKDLLNLAARLAGVADKKSTMPMLACALLRADGKTLAGLATDLYIGIAGAIDAEGKPGAIVVNAADLVSRIKVLPDGPVTLATTERALTIKAGGSARRFTLPTIPADDFPPIAKPNPDAPILKLRASMLSSIIASTAFAISPDETRPHISSLLIEWEGDTIRACATDGHRLAVAERKVEGQASASMLIQSKAVQELRRVLEDVKDGDVTLSLSGAYLFAAIGSLTLSTKLTDAQFPPWRQVIPSEIARTLRISRTVLVDAVRAVDVATDKSVRLSFDAGTLRITGESADKGDGADEVAYEVVSGKDGALIGVSPKYLLDPLGAIATDEVDLGTSGELDPIVIRPAGEGGHTNVVMPVRL